jgi:DNA-binding GntR family transcriptional regulator
MPCCASLISASRTGVRELRKLYQAMEKAARTDDEYRMWEHDRRFHLVLLQASGNLRLAEYVDGLRDMVLRRGVSTAGLSRSLDDIVAEHGEVLAHIESGDVDGVAEAMGAHLLRTAELLIAQEAGAPPGSVDIDLGWTGHP